MFRCGIKSDPVDRFQFLGRNVDAEVPVRKMRALSRHEWIEHRTDRRQSGAEPPQLIARREPVQIKIQAGPPYPEALCDFSDTATVLRLPQAADHGQGAFRT